LDGQEALSMTTHGPAFSVDDREFYPLHEEDEVSETKTKVASE
jgi:hypothetical protein